MKNLIVAALIGAVTAIAGYPVFDNGRINVRNCVILFLCITIGRLLSKDKDE